MAMINNISNQESIHRWSSPTLNTSLHSTLPTTSNLNFNHSSESIQPSHSALGLFLGFFCFITVFGNGLVIYAIVQERYLKSGMSQSFLLITMLQSENHLDESGDELVFYESFSFPSGFLHQMKSFLSCSIL